MGQNQNDTLNRVHCKDFLHNDLPDGCANLIIADPPYFEVKGGFDFIWPSFDAYLSDVEKWAQECRRLLSDNGTLFWWGMDRKIAYTQVILDRYFSLINNMVWERPGISSEWDTRRSFPERGMERLLMYGLDYEPGEWSKTGWERVMEEKIKPRHPFANYLRAEFERAVISIAEVRRFVTKELGFDSAMINRWLEGSSIMKPDIYRRFRQWLGPDYFNAEYESLRNEYESLRRPFNNALKLTDVLKFPQDQFAANVGHDTPKPIALTRALILTCSRPNDLVLVPFAGSGTECEAAVFEHRRFVGFEIDPKHATAANSRAEKAIREKKSKPALFSPDQQYTFTQTSLF